MKITFDFPLTIEQTKILQNLKEDSPEKFVPTAILMLGRLQAEQLQNCVSINTSQDTYRPISELEVGDGWFINGEMRIVYKKTSRYCHYLVYSGDNLNESHMPLSDKIPTTAIVQNIPGAVEAIKSMTQFLSSLNKETAQ